MVFGESSDIQAKLGQVQQVLLKLLGRPSRWSGLVELTENPYIRGAKPFRCDIVVNVELTRQDERWRTLIHEMLHTFSAGYLTLDYVSFRGWEEGVVENLQRVLRPTILAELGVTVAENIFSVLETDHEYAEYVQALEDIRKSFGEEPRMFYSSLLAVPLSERRQAIFEQGMGLPAVERQAFFQVYSRSNAVLKTGVAR